MTSSAAENYFIYATITLASVTSPGSTLSVYVSTRPYENGGNIYKPIIRSLNGIAYGMGAYVPRTSSGSITLDDSPHSYGFERRLSDLLERYSVLDQEIEIGIRLGTDLDDHVGTSGTAAVIFRGLIQDWKKDVSSQSLTLRVKGEDLPKTIMTRSINSTDFPSAPAQSLGKNLPIVFGDNVEIKPIVVGGTNHEPTFALTTTLKDQFVSGGVQTYYIKGKSGVYRSFANATSTSAPGDYTVAETGSLTGFQTSTYREFAWSQSIGNGLLVARGRIRGYATGDGTWLGGNGRLVMRIYKARNGDVTKGPGELVASATKLKSEYQASYRNTAGQLFWIDFVFEQPVLINQDEFGGSSFFVSFADVRESENTAVEDTPYGYCKNADPATIWIYTTPTYPGNGDMVVSGNSKTWVSSSGVFGPVVSDLFGVRFTETTSTGTNSSGLSYSKIDASYYGANGDLPFLNTLDLVASVNGLKDVNGYITTAGSVITRPDHAIELLTRYYAGSTWNNPTLDTTFFSDSTTGVSTSTDRYYRTVGGRSDGRALAAQIIEDIGKSCAVRVGLAISSTAGRRFTRFCWSTNRPTSAVFTNRNSNIIEIEQRDAATVINRATVFNGESLRGLSVESGSAENTLKNYSSVAQTYNGLDTTATALTSDSVTLYGERPNAAAGYKFLGSGGRMMSDYLCALFGRPHIYVTLETEARFYARECLEVVEILHPEVFAYFGTSADPGASTYAGTAVDPASGQYIVRAQTYRGQIEGKEFIFSDNEAPKIRFTIRLLTNYPNDPT